MHGTYVQFQHIPNLKELCKLTILLICIPLQQMSIRQGPIHACMERVIFCFLFRPPPLFQIVDLVYLKFYNWMDSLSCGALVASQFNTNDISYDSPTQEENMAEQRAKLRIRLPSTYLSNIEAIYSWLAATV